MMNNYNNLIRRNPLLPSCYSYNTYSKLNDMDNTAYIDTFLSFLCSELTINDKIPSFPIYYGSVNGIKKEYNYDISDDYQQYKNEKWFYKNLGDLYTLDLYISSDEEDNDIDIDNHNDNDNNNDNDNPSQISPISSVLSS